MAIEPTTDQIRVAFDLAKAWQSTPRGPQTKGRLASLRERRKTWDGKAESALQVEIDNWLKK